VCVYAVIVRKTALGLRSACGRNRKFFALSVTQQEAVDFATSRLRSSQQLPNVASISESHTIGQIMRTTLDSIGALERGEPLVDQIPG
jgi:hypothetical protein